METDLSVVIPTFKRKNSLFKLVSCLAMQKDIKLEVLIVDQNPYDFFSSEELLLLQNVKVIKQATPNVSLARNYGFLSSSSKYVLFIDDDLVPEEDFCQRGLNILKQHPQIRCFSPNVYSDLGIEKSIQNAKMLFTGGTVGNNLISISETISAAIFFERSYYFESGGFDPYLFAFAKAAEDQEFFIRMRKKSMTLWYALDLQLFHDENEAGGCEMRSQDYWITRRKCIMSWALRYRVHGSKKGKLSIVEVYKLLRSAILNRLALSKGPVHWFWNLFYLIEALQESGKFYELNKFKYENSEGFLTNHLFY